MSPLLRVVTLVTLVTLVAMVTASIPEDTRDYEDPDDYSDDYDSTNQIILDLIDQVKDDLEAEIRRERMRRNSEHDELKRDMWKMETEIEELKNTRAELSQELEASTSAREELQGEVAGLRETVEGLRETNRNLEGRLETERVERQELERKLTQESGARQDLQRRVATSRRELESLIVNSSQAAPPVAFHALVSVKRPVVSGRDYVKFENVTLNVGHGYDASTGVFTVPPGGGGLYYISVFVQTIVGESADFYVTRDPAGAVDVPQNLRRPRVTSYRDSDGAQREAPLRWFERRDQATREEQQRTSTMMEVIRQRSEQQRPLPPPLEVDTRPSLLCKLAGDDSSDSGDFDMATCSATVVLREGDRVHVERGSRSDTTPLWGAGYSGFTGFRISAL